LASQTVAYWFGQPDAPRTVYTKLVQCTNIILKAAVAAYS
jgi:hypothetical protein